MIIRPIRTDKTRMGGTYPIGLCAVAIRDVYILSSYLFRVVSYQDRPCVSFRAHYKFPHSVSDCEHRNFQLTRLVLDFLDQFNTQAGTR